LCALAVLFVSLKEFQRGQNKGSEPALFRVGPIEIPPFEHADEKLLREILRLIGRICVRPEMAGTGGVEIPMRAGKEPLVQQTPPERMEERATEVVGGRLPRITKLMALAVRFEDLLRPGTAKDYADLARLGGVSRARITQVMNLRNLAPVLQEQILWLPQDHSDNRKLNERGLRRISGAMDWRERLDRAGGLLLCLIRVAGHEAGAW
jgi:hypothetical protein